MVLSLQLYLSFSNLLFCLLVLYFIFLRNLIFIPFIYVFPRKSFLLLYLRNAVFIILYILHAFLFTPNYRSLILLDSYLVLHYSFCSPLFLPTFFLGYLIASFIYNYCKLLSSIYQHHQHQASSTSLIPFSLISDKKKVYYSRIPIFW